MSFAQQLEKRGFEKGKQQGMQANHQEVWQAAQQQGMQAGDHARSVAAAKTLLASRVDLSIIKAATGLTDAELAKIVKETEE